VVIVVASPLLDTRETGVAGTNEAFVRIEKMREALDSYEAALSSGEYDDIAEEKISGLREAIEEARIELQSYENDTALWDSFDYQESEFYRARHIFANLRSVGHEVRGPFTQSVASPQEEFILYKNDFETNPDLVKGQEGHAPSNWSVVNESTSGPPPYFRPTSDGVCHMYCAGDNPNWHSEHGSFAEYWDRADQWAQFNFEVTSEDHDSVYLRFLYTCASIDVGDGLFDTWDDYLEIRAREISEGGPWLTIYKTDNRGDFNEVIELNLSDLTNPQWQILDEGSYEVQFRFFSDNSNHAEGVYIDAIEIFYICAELEPPELLLPEDGAEDISVRVHTNFSCEAVPGTELYYLEITDQPDFSQTVCGGINNWPHVNAHPEWSSCTMEKGTTYYWRMGVRPACHFGFVFGEIRSFTTECFAAEGPMLVAPADGATDVVQPMMLEWQAVENAVTYWIELDTDPELGNATSILTSILYQNFDNLASSTTYYWRAKAEDQCGWGEWSEVRAFTTCALPEVPSTPVPQDGADDVAFPVSISWYDPSGATSYSVHLADDADFTNRIFDQQVFSSSVTIENLSEGTHYFWRVKANNDCGWTDWSDAWEFTTHVATAAAEIHGPELPTQFSLAQNYPNPFNLGTTIEFSIPQSSYVKLEIFDIAGRRVNELLNDNLSAGRYCILWDEHDSQGHEVASGIYFYSISTDQFTSARKMLLLK
jgi:hypothetical protein